MKLSIWLITSKKITVICFHVLRQDLHADIEFLHGSLLECSADVLILEEKADNTVENFIESFEILKNKDWNEIVLVTCENHTPRAMYICEAVRNHFNSNIQLRAKPSK